MPAETIQHRATVDCKTYHLRKTSSLAPAVTLEYNSSTGLADNLDCAMAMTKLHRLKRCVQGLCLYDATTSGRVRCFSLRQATSPSKHLGTHAITTGFGIVVDCNTEAAGRPACDVRALTCLLFICCDDGPECTRTDIEKPYCNQCPGKLCASIRIGFHSKAQVVFTQTI